MIGAARAYSRRYLGYCKCTPALSRAACIQLSLLHFFLTIIFFSCLLLALLPVVLHGQHGATGQSNVVAEPLPPQRVCLTCFVHVHDKSNMPFHFFLARKSKKANTTRHTRTHTQLPCRFLPDTCMYCTIRTRKPRDGYALDTRRVSLRTHGLLDAQHTHVHAKRTGRCLSRGLFFCFLHAFWHYYFASPWSHHNAQWATRVKMCRA